jgi:hypothetical protein
MLRDFKTLLSLTFIFAIFFETHSQNYSVELNSNISSKETLPFFLTANKFGTIPNSNNLLLNTAIFSDFKKNNSTLDIAYKASITGYTANKNNILINELYASIAIKNWQIDLGSKNDEIVFEGLSVSNGNIVNSINTRAFPGISLKTRDYLELPFAKNWLKVKATYAEYFLNDKRAVDNAHLHYKSLYFKSKLSSKLDLISGLDHFVQWGGTSKEFGKQPTGFKDYLKYITGTGDGNKTEDHINSSNAWGNHVGNYLFQLNYNGENSNWSIYLSHPFEDRSGREFANYPDALYGFFIELKKPKSFITHLITEFQYTKHHGKSSSENGLIDNYFNNSVYKSGWTYFGRTIGSPFFTTKAPEDGITYGIAENRFTSFNLGFKGYLSEAIQYKTNITYTKYAGWFNKPLNKSLFAPYLEVLISDKSIPFDITVGTTADFGDFLPTNFGGFLKLTKTNIF